MQRLRNVQFASTAFTSTVRLFKTLTISNFIVTKNIVFVFTKSTTKKKRNKPSFVVETSSLKAN